MSITVKIKDDDGDVQFYSVNNGIRLVNGSGTGYETFIQPSGSVSITQNGTYDVTNKSSAVVNVSGGASASLARDMHIQSQGFSQNRASQASDLNVTASVTIPSGSVIKSTICEVYVTLGVILDNDSPIFVYLNKLDSVTITPTVTEGQSGKTVSATFDIEDWKYETGVGILYSILNTGAHKGFASSMLALEVLYE